MKKSIIVAGALALALFAPSATAQKMGAINGSAPMATTALTYPKGRAGDALTIELKYQSINWGAGASVESATGKDGEAMRKRINDAAESSPLGELKTSGDIMIGGKAVAAGDYKVGFTVSDDLKWHLVLTKGTEKIDWALDLKDSGSAQTHLVLALVPGDKGRTCSLNLQFGKNATTVAVSQTPAAKQAAGDKKPGDKPAPPEKKAG